jgi:NAD(P)-dependent dehydrogenase (short-subunit alcohol dehydrogenase family)
MAQRYDNYDRIAVVTGSDSGIGEAIAVALARAGFDVGVTYHADKAGAESTADKVRAAGRRCEVRQLDLAHLPDAAAVVDDLADALGGLGVLVNNAGTAPGEIATPMTGNEDVDPHTLDRPGIPLGRPGDANEVAAVVAVLASSAGGYVTGSSWPVDGGLLLMGPQAASHLASGDWRQG